MVMTGQVGGQPEAWPAQSYDPRAGVHRTDRAFLSLCQQKRPTAGEPKADGGPRNKKSQSLARFPTLSQSLDTGLIALKRWLRPKAERPRNIIASIQGNLFPDFSSKGTCGP